MSTDTHKLIHRLAKGGAAKYADEMYCTSREHAQGVLTWLIRSTVHFAAVREHAYLLLDRLRSNVHVVGNHGARPPRRRNEAPPRAREWSNYFSRSGWPRFRHSEYGLSGRRRGG